MPPSSGHHTPPDDGLFAGRVMHHRLHPFAHRFTYRVFTLLLDIDSLGGLNRRFRLLRYNRPGVLSFHDRDHGARDGSPLRPWLEGLLADGGLGDSADRIMVLCYPRLWGYVFNPLTVYFCHRADGRLGAVVYEVKNTFGEQHAYVLAAQAPEPGRPLHQSCRKSFYVSPFIEMDARYRFSLRPPGDSVSLVIRQSIGERAQLLASFSGQRQVLRDATLARAVLRHPLMTAKVMTAIHWQALWLWLKGARFRSRPAPPPRAASYGRDGQTSESPRKSRAA